jgi:hypothetical protein
MVNLHDLGVFDVEEVPNIDKTDVDDPDQVLIFKITKKIAIKN